MHWKPSVVAVCSYSAQLHWGMRRFRGLSLSGTQIEYVCLKQLHLVHFRVSQ